MKNHNFKLQTQIIAGRKFAVVFTLILTYLFCTNCTEPKSHKDMAFSDHQFEEKQIVEIAALPPPFNDEYMFPCSECHAELETNTEPRKLEMHEEVDEAYNHDSENRWCLACHDAVVRDSLRLASGKLLDFKESYKLCGQCHGDKLRDWKVGVHGQRTGQWNGDKVYLLCVHCHDPHSPRFKELTPEPPPLVKANFKSSH